MMDVRRAALGAIRREAIKRGRADGGDGGSAGAALPAITATRSRRRPRRSAACTTSTRCAATAAQPVTAGPGRTSSGRRSQALMATLEAVGAGAAASRWSRTCRRGRRDTRAAASCSRATPALMFDVISPAVVAADLTISNLLEPARAARLVEQHADRSGAARPGRRDRRAGRRDVQGADRDAYEAEIARDTQRVLVENLMTLAAGAPMPQVRAIASHALKTRMAATSPPAAADDRARRARVAARRRHQALPRPPVRAGDAHRDARGAARRTHRPAGDGVPPPLRAGVLRVRSDASGRAPSYQLPRFQLAQLPLRLRMRREHRALRDRWPGRSSRRRALPSGR